MISTSRVDAVGARTFVLMIRFRTSLGAAPVFCVIFYEAKMVVCGGRSGGGDFLSHLLFIVKSQRENKRNNGEK